MFHPCSLDITTSIMHLEQRSHLFPKDDDASCLLYNFLSGRAQSYFSSGQQERVFRFADV